MAKKSAMSKGYRKTIKKKPFLTKKDIISTAILLAVIVLVVVLFNLFYDDGFVKGKDIKPGDVVSYASTDLRDRYKKVAEIGEVEGFTLDERGEDEAVISAYTFTPEDENSAVYSVSVNASFLEARSLVDTTLGYMAQLTSDSVVSEIQETSIQGYPAYVYSYSYADYDPSLDEDPIDETVEEAEPNVYSQTVSAYIAADETHTLCFHIYAKGADDSFYLADDQLVDFVNQYSTAFVLPQPEA